MSAKLSAFSAVSRPARFKWVGRDRFNDIQRGQAIADSRASLAQRLNRQGITPLRMQREWSIARRATVAEVSQLLHQLALLLQAGIHLKAALQLLWESTPSLALYTWIARLMAQLEGGFSLSMALQQVSPSYLHPQEIQLIQMGELSGQLPSLLRQIAQQRQAVAARRQKIRQVLRYPLWVLGLSLLVSLGLLWFIVPKFAELYQHKAQQLPWLTMWLFRLADGLQHDGLYWFVGGLLLAGVIYRLWQTDCLSRYRMRLLSSIPLFGGLISAARLLFFCQQSSMMLAAQLRLESVLQSFLDEHLHDIDLKQAISCSLTRLRQGYAFSDSLPSTLVSAPIRQMIRVGEQSGRLAEVLQHIAEEQQQHIDQQLQRITPLLEPLFMLLIGALVGTMLIGLYLPIFEMGAMIE